MRHARVGLMRFGFIDPLRDLVSEHLPEGGEALFASSPDLRGDVLTRHPKFIDFICVEFGGISAEVSNPQPR